MRTNFILATLVTVVMAAGCGDDGGGEDESSTNATPATPATPATEDEPTSTGDTGDTGSDTGDTGTSTTSDDTTGGSGGEVVNGCDLALADDLTGMPEVTITSVGLAYDTPCIKVSAGTNVTISSDFAAHPLRGGAIVDGVATPDAASPIPVMDSGDQASFTLATAGSYGYYCNYHFGNGVVGDGMVGAIIVE